MRPHRTGLVAVIALLLLAISGGPVAARGFGDWSAARPLESLPGSSGEVNTGALDGCPIQAPDGLSLYMASTRAGGLGGIDIWVAYRPSTDVGFGEPVNLTPVNSGADDFCPTPVQGKGLFFVSRRAGGCAVNSADMYFARRNPARGWTTPAHLGCAVNSTADELSPSYVEEDGAGALYFSSNRSGNQDIYRSAEQADGSFAAPQPLAAVNTAADESRPNVRKDGREIVFDSNRAGGLGATDIYAAARSSVDAPWSAPVNLGPAINSAAGESRASLSWDGQTLIFGSTRPGGEGSSDIYYSTREAVTGQP